MISLSYDLHIHSCLSPCAEDDMTPGNIVGMAAVKELDMIALTDHNSCKNCPAIMKMAKDFNLIVIPGIELCTVEEVHVIGLFPTLDDAMNFDEFLYKKLPPIMNNEDIFGNQYIYNEKDEIAGKELKLLINATEITFEQAFEKISEYNGIMIPAHLDRTSNSLISNLGFVPVDSKFKCAEIKDKNKEKDIVKANPYLEHCKIIYNSDAHYLYHISEPINYLNVKSRSMKDIFYALGHEYSL